MGLRIASNILSLTAQRSLATTAKALSRALERLASGKRINRAGDDPAGLAISNGLESQVRGYAQASRNMNDALGFMQTADGALATQTNLVQRMRELAVQSANGTLSDKDRSSLNGELQQLYSEFQRITSTANFNGTKLLDGSFGTKSLQVGTTALDKMDFNIGSSQASSIFTKQVTTGIGTYTADSQIQPAFEVQTLTASTGATIQTDITNDGSAAITLTSAAHTYTFWFNIAGSSFDPTFGGPNSFEIDLTGSETSTQVATLVSAAIAAHTNGDFSVSQSTNQLTVTNTTAAAVTRANNLGFYPAGFTFSEITQGHATGEIRVGTAPGQAANIVDINGDGFMDIVQSNAASNNISILLGNGNGSFSQAQTLTTGSSPSTTPLLVDLNGDGKLDLIQANSGSSSDTIYFGNGNGTFGGRQTVTLTSTAGALKLVDVNGDGKLDLVQSVAGDTDICLGNGDGTFGPAATLGIFGFDTLIQDFNGDGKPDIFVAGSTSTLLLGNGNGTFAVSQTFDTGSNFSAALSVGDINGDGKPDVLQSDGFSFKISVFLGNGNGTFAVGQTLTGAIFPFGAPQLGDINGDGKLDIVQANESTGDISVFLGNGNGTFAVGQTLTIPIGANTAPRLLDINGDGRLDIIQSNRNANNISVFLGRGDGSFAQSQTITTGLYPAGRPQMADVNGDGVADILQTNETPGSLSIFLADTVTNTCSAVADVNISTQSAAENMIQIADNAIANLASNRANIGAFQSRLSFAQDTVSVTQENIAQARSQILDTDYASETGELVRNQILQQAGIAVLGQANVSMQMALQLLSNLNNGH